MFFAPWILLVVANAWQTPRHSRMVRAIAETCSSTPFVSRHGGSPVRGLMGQYRSAHLFLDLRRRRGRSSWRIGGVADISVFAISPPLSHWLKITKKVNAFSTFPVPSATDCWQWRTWCYYWYQSNISHWRHDNCHRLINYCLVYSYLTCCHGCSWLTSYNFCSTYMRKE